MGMPRPRFHTIGSNCQRVRDAADTGRVRCADRRGSCCGGVNECDRQSCGGHAKVVWREWLRRVRESKGRLGPQWERVLDAQVCTKGTARDPGNYEGTNLHLPVALDYREVRDIP